MKHRGDEFLFCFSRCRRRRRAAQHRCKYRRADVIFRARKSGSSQAKAIDRIAYRYDAMEWRKKNRCQIIELTVTDRQTDRQTEGLKTCIELKLAPSFTRHFRMLAGRSIEILRYELGDISIRADWEKRGKRGEMPPMERRKIRMDFMCFETKALEDNKETDLCWFYNKLCTSVRLMPNVIRRKLLIHLV